MLRPSEYLLLPKFSEDLVLARGADRRSGVWVERKAERVGLLAKLVNPGDGRLDLDFRLRAGFVRSCVMLGLLRDEPKVRREVPERVLGLADNDEAVPAVGRRLPEAVAGAFRPEELPGRRLTLAGLGARLGAERVTGAGRDTRLGAERVTGAGLDARLGATLVVAGTGRPERGAAAGAEEGLRVGAARVTDGARAGAVRVAGEGLDTRPGRRLTFEGLAARPGAERLPPDVERVKELELAELLRANEEADMRRASALCETANVSVMIAIEKSLLFFMACSFSR